MEALIFDCDGVLVDTERDGHRVSFNLAFEQKGIDAIWSVDTYKELLKIAGGKERMIFYFDNHGWPKNIRDKEELIKELHFLKTNLFMNLIESGKLPLRPGVARLIDEAIDRNVKLAVCSTSNEKAVNKIVEILLGSERHKKFNGIFAGDIVAKKKPAPDIYNLCSEKLGLKPKNCIVVEDSRNGLLAAKSASFNCIITTNDYSKDEDFTEADAVFDELGDNPVKVNIEVLNGFINHQ